jgi:transglycosylase-like protein with SLT domain/D-alanyl-D-alanine carboxypeptidase-like protein
MSVGVELPEPAPGKSATGPVSLVSTELGGAGGGLALAAAIGVTLAKQERSVLVAELGAERRRGPTTLASASARELERTLREHGLGWAAARGRICWLGLPGGEEALGGLASALGPAGPALSIVHLPAHLWRIALDEGGLGVRSGLIRADLPGDRPLTALAVIELRERRLPVRVATRPLGLVASRRALAGLEAGGAAARRVARLARGLVGPPPSPLAERGQALPLTLGATFAILFCAALLAIIGGAATGTARAQRGADLVALSGARSLREDFARLFTPERLPDGTVNPRHLSKAEYLARAIAVARQAASRNGVDPAQLRVTFPDRSSFAPVRVRAEIRASVDPATPLGLRSAHGARADRREAINVTAHAEAEASPPGFAATPSAASGGGYSGPLVYRQGKPMRPDVATAFDRMAGTASRSGIALTITSAFRSDAEQAQLYAQHPDPRWVAPPGTSLHRCATELDLGPPSAYGWLAANAPRFGFSKRYSWEPWHLGFVRGPAPCSAAGDSVEVSLAGDGQVAARGGLPAFVPSRFREPIMVAASRWNVSAGVLAAQLLAESNFNPYAVSGAGAQGIAQFMPATARAYGLRDPFDAAAAIDAQAHLMADLLGRFGSVSLALAAYNAGPVPVAACRCVPSIPETQAYVARILGLLGGAGELAAPALEVRLVD